MGFDLTGKTKESADDILDGRDSGSFEPLPDDYYEVEIEQVVMPDDESDNMQVTLRVIVGAVTGKQYKDRTIREYFKDPDSDRCNKPKYATERLILLALASGIVSKKDFEGGREPDFDDAVGRNIIVLTRQSKAQNGNVYSNVSFKSIYSPDDESLKKKVKEFREKQDKASKLASL